MLQKHTTRAVGFEQAGGNYPVYSIVYVLWGRQRLGQQLRKSRHPGPTFAAWRKRGENLARSNGLVTNDGLLYLYWIVEASINWLVRAICGGAVALGKKHVHNTQI